MRQRRSVGGAHERLQVALVEAQSLETVCSKRPETDILLAQGLKVQYAFSILLIRGNMPFTALIAICGVLHRFQSRDIQR